MEAGCCAITPTVRLSLRVWESTLRLPISTPPRSACDAAYPFLADPDPRQGTLFLHSRGGAVGGVAKNRHRIADRVCAAHLGFTRDSGECGSGCGARSG